MLLQFGLYGKKEKNEYIFSRPIRFKIYSKRHYLTSFICFIDFVLIVTPSLTNLLHLFLDYHLSPVFKVSRFYSFYIFSCQSFSPLFPILVFSLSSYFFHLHIRLVSLFRHLRLAIHLPFGPFPSEHLSLQLSQHCKF